MTTTPDIDEARRLADILDERWPHLHRGAPAVLRALADELERLRALDLANQGVIGDYHAERDALRGELDWLRAQVATAGWKLVPVEPTQEMLDAVVTTLDDHLLGPAAEQQYREDWAAMLAASPAAPAQQAPDNNSLGKAGCFPAAEKTNPPLTVGDQNSVTIERPDLFDLVRAAYFSGGNNDDADTAALHGEAFDYANKTLTKFYASLAPAAQAEPAPGHLTRFDAVQRALDLASLIGGSIGQNDRGSTEAYRAQLREHLLAYIPDAAQAESTVERLRQALKFYADGDHFIKHQPDAWDTVSGEPANFWEDESNTATVEDGSVAKAALEGVELQNEDGTPFDTSAQGAEQPPKS